MRTIALVFLAILLIPMQILAQQQTQEVLETGEKRLQENQQAQQTVDQSQEQIHTLGKEYLAELKLLDGLNMYNAMLKRQLDDQESQIQKLNNSINNATQIERQIMPLLVRMVDALEALVAVDMPFLQEERQERVANLRALLDKAEFTTSEKTRRVFEAYQIENEYGYTIESYKGRVSVEGNQFAVDFLRIGRIGLMYRDLAGERVGMWDKESGNWRPLTDQQYLRHITKGLKVAREEVSPELITLPLLSMLEVR